VINLATMHQPDLILMNINLPDMDGFKALNQLQQNELISHKEYITKPIDVEKLLTTVESTLSQLKKHHRMILFKSEIFISPSYHLIFVRCRTG